MEWVSIASASLGFGALLARFFFTNPSARIHLSTAVLAFAGISIVITVFQSSRRAVEVRDIGEKIYSRLGIREKTADQIIFELNNPSLQLFSSALGWLEKGKRIESEVKDATIPNVGTVKVRTWRALASP